MNLRVVTVFLAAVVVASCSSGGRNAASSGTTSSVAPPLVTSSRSTASTTQVGPDVVPVALADGRPPAAIPSMIVAAVPVPVIAARTFGPGDPLTTACVVPVDPGLASVRSLGGVITPEGLSVGVVGGSPRQLETCEAERQQSHWTHCGASHADWPSDASLATNGGGTSLCVQSRPPFAFGWVAPPSRSAWVVQDRGNYMLAYPVVAGNPVRISTANIAPPPASGMRVHFLFFDDQGSKLGEQTTDFYVAS